MAQTTRLTPAAGRRLTPDRAGLFWDSHPAQPIVCYHPATKATVTLAAAGRAGYTVTHQAGDGTILDTWTCWRLHDAVAAVREVITEWAAAAAERTVA